MNTETALPKQPVTTLEDHVRRPHDNHVAMPLRRAFGSMSDLADPDASAGLDSSPQQQPPAVDYHYNDLPSTNFLAINNLNLDSTAPTISTDTTVAINNNGLGSSSQQELPEQQANGADDGFGLQFTSPSSTGPLLLLSSNECDKSQNGDGRHPNDRAHQKRKKKRQLLNCPNPYLTTPNSPANSIKTLESGDDDNGRTQRGGVDQATGLIIQKKPEPNLGLCPDVERPIPVCGREDSKVPMGDSFLLPKCRAYIPFVGCNKKSFETLWCCTLVTDGKRMPNDITTDAIIYTALGCLPGETFWQPAPSW